MALLGTASCVLAGPRVFAKDGRILMESSGGKSVSLTTSGRDSDPWLTPDVKSVLFVRTDVSDSFRSRVYSVDIDSKRDRVVFDGPLNYKGHQIASLAGPEMDPRGQYLFVMAKTSPLNGALFAVDLNSKASRFIAECVSFHVVQSGPHAGDLLVYLRKQSVVGAAYSVYWLYSAGGNDLGIAGPDGMDTSAVTPVAEVSAPEPVEAIHIDSYKILDKLLAPWIRNIRRKHGPKALKAWCGLRSTFHRKDA
jgi:hypothetical protein